jgi:hypothetical protein
MNKSLFYSIFLLSFLQSIYSSEGPDAKGALQKQIPDAQAAEEAEDRRKAQEAIRNETEKFLQILAETANGMTGRDKKDLRLVGHLYIDELLNACQNEDGLTLEGVALLKSYVSKTDFINPATDPFYMFNNAELKKLLTMVKTQRTLMLQEENRELYKKILESIQELPDFDAEFKADLAEVYSSLSISEEKYRKQIADAKAKLLLHQAEYEKTAADAQSQLERYKKPLQLIEQARKIKQLETISKESKTTFFDSTFGKGTPELIDNPLWTDAILDVCEREPGIDLLENYFNYLKSEDRIWTIINRRYTQEQRNKLSNILKEKRNQMLASEEGSLIYQEILQSIIKKLVPSDAVLERDLKSLDDKYFEKEMLEKLTKGLSPDLFMKTAKDIFNNEGTTDSQREILKKYLVRYVIDNFTQAFTQKGKAFFVDDFFKPICKSVQDEIGKDLKGMPEEEQLKEIMKGNDSKILLFYITALSGNVRISKELVKKEDSVFQNVPTIQDSFQAFAGLLVHLRLNSQLVNDPEKFAKLLIDTCGKFIQSKFVAQNPDLWKKLMDAASDTIVKIAKKDLTAAQRLSDQMQYFFEKTFAFASKGLSDAPSKLFKEWTLRDYFHGFKMVTGERTETKEESRFFEAEQNYSRGGWGIEKTSYQVPILKSLNKAKYFDTSASIREKLNKFGCKQIGWIQRKFDFLRSLYKGYYFNKTDDQRYKSAMSITASFKRLLDTTQKVGSIGMSEKDIQSFLRNISILLRSLKSVSSLNGQPTELLQRLLALKPFQNDDTKWQKFINDHLLSRAADEKQAPYLIVCKKIFNSLVSKPGDESITIDTQQTPRGVDFKDGLPRTGPTTEGTTSKELPSGSGAQRPRTGSQSSSASADTQHEHDKELEKQREKEAAAKERGHVGGQPPAQELLEHRA